MEIFLCHLCFAEFWKTETVTTRRLLHCSQGWWNSEKGKCFQKKKKKRVRLFDTKRGMKMMKFFLCCFQKPEMNFLCFSPSIKTQKHSPLKPLRYCSVSAQSPGTHRLTQSLLIVVDPSEGFCALPSLSLQVLLCTDSFLVRTHCFQRPPWAKAFSFGEKCGKKYKKNLTSLQVLKISICFAWLVIRIDSSVKTPKEDRVTCEFSKPEKLHLSNLLRESNERLCWDVDKGGTDVKRKQLFVAQREKQNHVKDRRGKTQGRRKCVLLPEALWKRKTRPDPWRRAFTFAVLCHTAVSRIPTLSVSAE